MTEPEPTGYISVDDCNHKPVYPDHEWVCSLCGKVLSVEEVEEIQRGSAATTTVTTHEDLGLDPHGRTPLWLAGLGSIEGYTHMQQSGDRDDISILSNIASKLELPSYAALEFLQLYRAFVKDREKDRVCAAKLALLLITARYPLLMKRMRLLAGRSIGRMTERGCAQYISSVVDMHFGSAGRRSRTILPLLSTGTAVVERYARRYGATKAVNMLMKSRSMLMMKKMKKGEERRCRYRNSSGTATSTGNSGQQHQYPLIGGVMHGGAS